MRRSAWRPGPGTIWGNSEIEAGPQAYAQRQSGIVVRPSMQHQRGCLLGKTVDPEIGRIVDQRAVFALETGMTTA
jgi:hypothetical protein